MPLFKKKSRYEVDADNLKAKNSVSITRLANAKSSWSKHSILKDCRDLCKKSIKKRTEPGNSFMLFGMVFGENAEDIDTADKIWADVWKLYNGDKDPDFIFDLLRRLLGTILMIEVAEDSGTWEYEPDPEKRDKLAGGEKPDAAIYNLRKPR